MNLCEALIQRGWYIRNDSLSQFLDARRNLPNSPIKDALSEAEHFFLHSDLTCHGRSWFKMQRNGNHTFAANGVLQFVNRRNVTFPYSQSNNCNYELYHENLPETNTQKLNANKKNFITTSPFLASKCALFKYEFTDGEDHVCGLDVNNECSFNIKTVLPGSKFRLHGDIAMSFCGGFLMMQADSMQLLGGALSNRIDSAELAESCYHQQNEAHFSSSISAPKFLPFGQPLQLNVFELKSFKATPIMKKYIKSVNQKATKKPDSLEADKQFSLQRDALIRKATANKNRDVETHSQNFQHSKFAAKLSLERQNPRNTVNQRFERYKTHMCHTYLQTTARNHLIQTRRTRQNKKICNSSQSAAMPANTSASAALKRCRKSENLQCNSKENKRRKISVSKATNRIAASYHHSQ